MAELATPTATGNRLLPWPAHPSRQPPPGNTVRTNFAGVRARRSCGFEGMRLATASPKGRKSRHQGGQGYHGNREKRSASVETHTSRPVHLKYNGESGSSSRVGYTERAETDANPAYRSSSREKRVVPPFASDSFSQAWKTLPERESFRLRRGVFSCRQRTERNYWQVSNAILPARPFEMDMHSFM